MEDKSPKKNWHALTEQECLEALKSDIKKGLSKEAYESQLSTHGKNELPVEDKQSAIVRFLLQFHNVLIYLLITASIVTAFLGHWIDTFVILAVVFVNAIVGFIQEGKAEEAIEQLRKMLSPVANVIRNGQRQEVNADSLVPGDIVLLKSGDRVPADLRILNARNLRIEEAILTGESKPAEKNEDILDDKTGLADRLNMAFSGTMVTYGRGTGVVVETGMETEIGKIRQMISDVEKLTTPLLRKMNAFAKWLSIIIIAISVLILLFGWLFTEEPLKSLFLSVIALAVAAIPEGLPAIMTITLAIGVRKMAARNAIIRKLPAVETLGSVSVICTDKTGTLTRNEMMVMYIKTKHDDVRVTGKGYMPEGKFSQSDEEINPLESEKLKNLLQCAVYCNDAEIVKDKAGEWILNGDPTEGALMSVAMKAGLNKENAKRIDFIPFESENKYMATLNESDDERIVFVKGAAERIIDFSNLDSEQKKEWVESMNQLAAEGLRVMGLALKKMAPDTEKITEKEVKSELEFLGLVGIIDPPREEAITSIEHCKEAGIKIKMITGDHAVTASAIGKKIGIENSENVITGNELSEFKTDEEWIKAANEYSIFARTNPEHKLKLVEALQSQQQVIAMTGDGVNDAPALKRADVGIAMGIKGTEVTKNAADMVLADDNFNSIESAVEEGRTIYQNLRKAILFILPTNGAEALLIISSIIAGFTLPITPVQVLWVNMVTAVTLALALAFEPTEKDIMKLPPRPSDEPVIGGYFIWRIFFVSILVAGLSLALFFYFKINYSVEFARTIALNTLVAGQVFYLFNSRYLYNSNLSFAGIFGNSKVLIAAGVLLILQLSLTYLPFMQTWFETQSLELYHWLILTACGLTVFLCVEFEKWVYRRFVM
ncbi:MAG: cation-transporting P-type ATPase [Chitinophagaceae bacterium]|nr:MAG: cation-transporting P-type ATPase [Chitinophagaceae bacterium]